MDNLDREIVLGHGMIIPILEVGVIHSQLKVNTIKRYLF